MSIKTSSRVWEYSPEKGSSLLALLAIADHADDYGVAWPGMGRIAKKARVSKRQAQRLVQGLEERGELYIEQGGGRGHSSRYFLTTGLDKPAIIAILTKHPELELLPLEAEATATKIIELQKKGDADVTVKRVTSGAERVTSGVERVTSGVGKGDIVVSPEPSVTINEPSVESSDGAKPPLDYLEHVFDLSQRPNRAGIADPTQDLKQWFRFRDEAIQAVRDITGAFPNPSQQGIISDLVDEPGFNMELWEKSICSCEESKVKPGNVRCYIDTYRDGGNYQEMCEKRRNGGPNARPIRTDMDPRSPAISAAFRDRTRGGNPGA